MPLSVFAIALFRCQISDEICGLLFFNKLSLGKTLYVKLKD